MADTSQTGPSPGHQEQDQKNISKEQGKTNIMIYVNDDGGYDNLAMERDEVDTRYMTMSSASDNGSVERYQIDEPTDATSSLNLVVSEEKKRWGKSKEKPEPVEALRMTRLTEIVPSDCRITDTDESQLWKMPLEIFTSKKQGPAIENLTSKRIRSYYQAQDELIEAYEEISNDARADDYASKFLKRKQRNAALVSRISFGINVALLIAKLVASILSGSISIISSLVDSAVDILSGILMWWATRAVKKRDPYIYPQGRTKLEPISIIILSVIMGLTSIQLIRESVEKIESLNGDSPSLPTMTATTFAIAGSTIVIKFFMWAIYRRIDSTTVQAIAQDSRNDVMSNSVAILCGYLGSQEFQDQTHLHGFIYVDPTGAMLICLYIIFNWWRTGSEQIRLLTGRSARPDFLSKLTWVALNHDSNIRNIDTVKAFHFGNNFLVEVDILLPESTSLKMAHDIGESLQNKLEKIPEVERAFVHVDYEFSHKPNTEHKVV